MRLFHSFPFRSRNGWGGAISPHTRQGGANANQLKRASKSAGPHITTRVAKFGSETPAGSMMKPSGGRFFPLSSMQRGQFPLAPRWGFRLDIPFELMRSRKTGSLYSFPRKNIITWCELTAFGTGTTNCRKILLDEATNCLWVMNTVGSRISKEIIITRKQSLIFTSVTVMARIGDKKNSFWNTLSFRKQPWQLIRLPALPFPRFFFTIFKIFV